MDLAKRMLSSTKCTEYRLLSVKSVGSRRAVWDVFRFVTVCVDTFVNTLIAGIDAEDPPGRGPPRHFGHGMHIGPLASEGYRGWLVRCS